MLRFHHLWSDLIFYICFSHMINLFSVILPKNTAGYMITTFSDILSSIFINLPLTVVWLDHPVNQNLPYSATDEHFMVYKPAVSVVFL